MAPALALTLLLAAPATPAATDPEFRELVRKSGVDYNLGYFDAALKEAEEAYRMVQLPALLFNLGQCHRSLGHWERAEFFYRSYLRNNPSAKNKDLVLELIDKMVAKEKEAPATAAPPPSDGAVQPTPPGPAVVVVEAPTPAPAEPTPAPTTTPTPAATTVAATPVSAPSAAVGEAHLDEATASAKPARVWPWVLGGGAVLFAGGAVWGWYEAATFSSYKSTVHTYPEVQSQQTLATAGEVVGIAGAVVAAALLSGAVLTW